MSYLADIVGTLKHAFSFGKITSGEHLLINSRVKSSDDKFTFGFRLYDPGFKKINILMQYNICPI